MTESERTAGSFLERWSRKKIDAERETLVQEASRDGSPEGAGRKRRRRSRGKGAKREPVGIDSGSSEA